MKRSTSKASSSAREEEIRALANSSRWFVVGGCMAFLAARGYEGMTSGVMSSS